MTVIPGLEKFDADAQGYKVRDVLFYTEGRDQVTPCWFALLYQRSVVYDSQAAAATCYGILQYITSCQRRRLNQPTKHNQDQKP